VRDCRSTGSRLAWLPVRRLPLLAVLAAALAWAAPASALPTATGKVAMDDGVALAYDLYEPQ
jgi:hypothetical protein